MARRVLVAEVREGDARRIAGWSWAIVADAHSRFFRLLGDDVTLHAGGPRDAAACEALGIDRNASSVGGEPSDSMRFDAPIPRDEIDLDTALATVPADVWRLHLLASGGPDFDVSWNGVDATAARLAATFGALVDDVARRGATPGTRGVANGSDEADAVLRAAVHTFRADRPAHALAVAFAALDRVRENLRAMPENVTVLAEALAMLRKLLPLLGCAMPRLCERAWQRLGFPEPFDGIRLSDAEGWEALPDRKPPPFEPLFATPGAT